jgi:O-antigen ligase
MAAFLFLQYRIWRTAREAYRWSRNWMARGLSIGVLAAMAGLVAHSLGTISFLIVRIMEPFWFLVALTVVVRALAIEEHAAQARKCAADQTPQEAALQSQAAI